jgi:hypothetical protein
VKQASMHRLIESGWLGRAGCDRKVASTAAIAQLP